MNKVQSITIYSSKWFQTLVLELKISWYPQTENGTNSTLFKRPLDRLSLEKMQDTTVSLKKAKYLMCSPIPFPVEFHLEVWKQPFQLRTPVSTCIIKCRYFICKYTKNSSLWIQELNNRRESHQESLSCASERPEDFYFPSLCNRKEMFTVQPSLEGTSDNPQQYATRGIHANVYSKSYRLQCLNAFISVKAVSGLTSSLYSIGLTNVCTGVRSLIHNNFVLKMNPPIKRELKWLTFTQCQFFLQLRFF